MDLSSKRGFYHSREAEDSWCPLRAFLRSLIHGELWQEQEQDQHGGSRSGFSFIPEAGQDPGREDPWLPWQEGFVGSSAAWELAPGVADGLKLPLF